MKLNDWAERLLEFQIGFDQRDKRAYIDNPGRARWLYIRMLFGLVVGLATLLYVSLRIEQQHPWETLVSVLFGLLVGRGFMGGMRRAQAYRDGWLAGRRAMIESLREAERRGMTLDEWEMGEMSRDIGMLFGRPVIVADPPEGGE